MKTKLLILSAALFCAAGLSVNAKPVYGGAIPAPALACAPAAVACHSDWRDAGRHDYDRHDYRHDRDFHRR